MKGNDKVIAFGGSTWLSLTYSTDMIDYTADTLFGWTLEVFFTIIKISVEFGFLFLITLQSTCDGLTGDNVCYGYKDQR